MFLTPIDSSLRHDDGRWVFLGDPHWRLDDDGVLYPPVFANPRFDRGADRVPDLYAHPLAREDYAVLATEPLEDTDIAFDYACPYGSVLHGGFVLRAAGGMGCYVVDIFEMGRKAQAYEVLLWLQDESGYRRELARGQVPHSVIPERINQTGTPTRFLWDHSSPEWMRFRVQASGTFLRVSASPSDRAGAAEHILFEVRDDTYPAGCVGLVARGSVYFRNLTVAGVRAADTPAWEAPASAEVPAFCYPGDPQPEGFNAYPVVCRTPDGGILAAWAHDPNPSSESARRPTVILTRSDDGGRTWNPPEPVWQGDCHYVVPSSLFAHLDGTVSLLVSRALDADSPARCLRTRSVDGGRTWSALEEFDVAGRPLSERPFVHPYSPMQRLGDSTVVMTCYEADSSRGEANDKRRDRSLFLRSHDDGLSWDEEPVYLDAGNFDHNECMVAEVGDSRLVAFLRTLRAPFMWTSTSQDGGRTWAPLTQTDINAECPCLLHHSCGALVLGSRGLGLFVRRSDDGGRTWSATVRVSTMSAMMGMVELEDGRILLIGHEGYRVPGNIRGHFIRITDDGFVAA